MKLKFALFLFLVSSISVFIQTPEKTAQAIRDEAEIW